LLWRFLTHGNYWNGIWNNMEIYDGSKPSPILARVSTDLLDFCLSCVLLGVLNLESKVTLQYSKLIHCMKWYLNISEISIIDRSYVWTYNRSIRSDLFGHTRLVLFQGSIHKEVKGDVVASALKRYTLINYICFTHANHQAVFNAILTLYKYLY
jgi:hypothetical protein